MLEGCLLGYGGSKLIKLLEAVRDWERGLWWAQCNKPGTALGVDG